MTNTRIVEEYAVLLSSGALLEVAGYPKPGNVHRLRDYEDIWFEDFLLSSHIILLNNLRAVKRGLRGVRGRYSIGDLVYDSLKRSMRVHGGGNTCLGIALILHPLAYTAGYMVKNNDRIIAKTLVGRVPSILEQYTTPYDSVMFYRAVRTASPSYIRETDDTGIYPNVWDREYEKKLIERGIGMYEILVYSSKRDLVEREIVNGYPNVLKAKEFLEKIVEKTRWNYAVIGVFLYLGSNLIDTVVSRTIGYENAVRVREILTGVFEKYMETIEGGRGYDELFNELLKVDEKLVKMNARLGAVADLVAATISLYALDKKRSLIH